ncbi:hypothetical protein [Acinetobacter sp. KS-LM10]|uniref:hypothetical protein n=1 Tax=Acinetobacter sp. KS-LM10 TaxID=3120518 RepID=UPI0030D40278
MSTVIQSNKKYTGSKALPNIIDSLTTTAQKIEYLKKTYASVNGDSAYITSANADSIFAKLKSHRERVIADGGIVLSNAMTLRAIIFAVKNSLTASVFSAVSVEFGIKTSGGAVLKVYDLSGRDLEPVDVSFGKSEDGNLIVLKNTSGTGTGMLTKTSLTAGSGMIVGMSSNDVNTDAASYVRNTVYQNTAGTGNAFSIVENNNGNIGRLSYINVAGGFGYASFDQVGSAYKKYSGIVGLIIPTGGYIFENGLQKGVQILAPKNNAGLAAYPAVVSNSANSFINESWVIVSESRPLAVDLSIHLNKSVFN